MYATFMYHGTPLQPLRSACTVMVRYKYVYRYTPNILVIKLLNYLKPFRSYKNIRVCDTYLPFLRNKWKQC